MTQINGAMGGARVDPLTSVTGVLRQWSEGDAQSADRVFELLYAELHRTAAAYFNYEKPGHTLQPTALVSEAFLRLATQRPVAWESRSHFLAFAARVMRQVLVDHARSHSRQKRGAGLRVVSLGDSQHLLTSTPTGLLELHDALERLAESDPQKATVVELRFFGGLTLDEISTAMGTSRASVGRLLRRARAWLYLRMKQGGDR